MSFCANLLLTVFSSLLFFLSHPNFLFVNGLGFLGFFCLAPVFVIVRCNTLRSLWLWGALYGFLSYGLFFSWLISYSIIAYLLALPVMALMMAFVFWAMGVVSRLCCGFEFFSMAFVWCVYEYCKTLGFVGLSYGVLGYSQWTNLYLMQSAAVGGVWIPSLCCALVAAGLADFSVQTWLGGGAGSLEKRGLSGAGGAGYANRGVPGITRIFFAKLLPLCLTVFFVLSLELWGAIRCHAVSTYQSGSTTPQTFPLVLVQNNTDSTKYGIDVYKRDVATLVRLTEDALRQHPDTQMVVWPETAVVPPITQYFSSSSDPDRHKMVLGLLDYLERTDSAFVIGNQYSIQGRDKETEDYNSALVFDTRQNNVIPPRPIHYAKQHLVPFTEYFPYKIPFVYDLLQREHGLWTPGKNPLVINCRGMDFSCPICFEDTFGNDCRRFVLAGAKCLVNISNDSWSNSMACQHQHLSMAVFRAVENNVPMVRSCASGVTCSVDQIGRISSAVPEFQEEWLYTKLILDGKEGSTLYTRYGDYIPRIQAVLLCLILAFKTVRNFLEKRKPVRHRCRK